MYDAIVIGSGINELTLAAYLAQARAKVLVLEEAATIGGPAATIEIAPGFRAEPCAESAGWIAPRIVKELGLAEHGLDVETSDPTVVVPSEDGGEPFVLYREMERSIESIKKRSPADAGKFEAFSARMARLAGFLESLYTTDAPRLMSEGAGDMLTLMGHGLRLRRLGKVDMVELLRTLPMSLSDLLDDWFETDALKSAIAAGGLANLFQGPRSQGTCFSMLHHVIGRPQGAFRARTVCKGERGHLGAVLAGAAKQLGVEMRAGAPCEVRVKDGRASGVVVKGGEAIDARVVVSGADPRRTFLRLLDPSELEPEFVRAVRNVKLRGIRAFVHLALGELPALPGAPDLGGVLSIAPTLDHLEHAYDDAKHGRVSANPFLEATVPSLKDPSLAPAGKHVLSVAVQYVPFASPAEGLGDRVVETLARHVPNLRGAIEGRLVLLPRDFESRFGLTEGHLYQGELTLDQILFMRPIPGFAHYATPLEGLFLCGAATHPGGALPGLSGANAAREVLKALRE
jgi:phytoene dehydrogenase-like protein